MKPDFADAVHAYDDVLKRAPKPVPQPCHECGVEYAGIACPNCKTERPAWVALKNTTKGEAR